MESHTVYHLLEQWRHSEKEAIVYHSDRITYKQLFHLVEGCYRYLQPFFERNEPGNNIGILMSNCSEYVLAYFLIAKAGKTIVPLNANSTNFELNEEIRFCDLTCMIVDKKHLQKALSNDSLRSIILLDASFDYSDIEIPNDPRIIRIPNSVASSQQVVPSPQIDEHSTAILLHTSGTTSKRKKVMLSHHNLISNVISHTQALNLKEEDKVVITLPIYFGYANTSQLLTHINLGGTVVILDNFCIPQLLLKTLEVEKATLFTAVPSTLFLIKDFLKKKKYELSSLRYICFGGGITPKELILNFKALLPWVDLVQTYGLTEASPRVTALVNAPLDKYGSVGVTLPGVEIKIVSSDSQTLGPHQTGEILVKGNNVMKGYYKQEEITKETIVDGWLYTGDYGAMDEEGYLYLKGRKKNIIISGGINIYPEEIEEKLLEHPLIEEAIVKGKHDEILGEVPVAIIKTKERVSSEEIIKYCKSYFSGTKIPRDIIFTESFDKTYTGKIKRY